MSSMLRRSTIGAMMALSRVHAAVHTSIPPSDAITSAPTSTIVQCAMPSMCTGDATIAGEVTHLTYICPTPTATHKSQKTVYVTVTVPYTVAPTATIIVTDVPGPASSDALNPIHWVSQEPVTTSTLYLTSTITKTMTIARAKPHTLDSSTASETDVTETSTDNVATSISGSSLAESSSETFAHGFSYLPQISATYTHEPGTSTEAGPTKNYSSTVLVVSTVVISPSPIESTFPTLTLSANGSTTEGVFYSRTVTPGNESLILSTGETTTYSLLEGRDQLGGTGALTITLTTTVNATTTEEHATMHYDHTSTPTAAYPGAVTASLGGKGGAGRQKVSLGALFGVLLLAALIL